MSSGHIHVSVGEKKTPEARMQRSTPLRPHERSQCGTWKDSERPCSITLGIEGLMEGSSEVLEAGLEDGSDI